MPAEPLGGSTENATLTLNPPGHVYAIKGVFTAEDVDLLNSSMRRDNGWKKWGDVDKLKAEGEELARSILDQKWTRACGLVNLLRKAPWLPGPRVTELVGVDKPS